MRKHGFTLIELLVVAAVVAVLLALLTPAVHHARDDARRIACRNNLKQIGLALHNYHEAFVTMPPGWVAKAGHPGDGARFGWMVFLTPFVDHAPLYNTFNFSDQVPPPTAPAHYASKQYPRPFQAALAVYRCPADSTPAINAFRGNYGTSNYSANYGSEPLPRLMPLGLADFWPGLLDAPMKSNGLFARNSSVRFAGVTDGLSNTIMAGEKCFTSGSGIWPGVTDNAHEDDAVTDGSHGSRPNAGLSSWSSRHEGGVNVLMGDGAVRFLADTVDSRPGPELGTLQKLTNRADRQPIGEF